MKKYLVGIALLVGSMLYGQITEEEKTKVLDRVQGNPLFVLQEGEKLFSYEPVEGWYKVRKMVRLKLSDVEGKLVNPGTVLRKTNGDSIGYTMVELRAKELKKVDEFRGKGWYEAILEGYLFKTKIKENSIQEKELTKVLAIRNRTEQPDAFRALAQDNNMEERKFGDLTAYVSREENKTLGEDKDFRLIMIFRNSTMPFAVITNNHSVELAKMKTEWEDGDFKVQYISKPSKDQQEIVQNTILYTFLAL